MAHGIHQFKGSFTFHRFITFAKIESKFWWETAEQLDSPQLKRIVNKHRYTRKWPNLYCHLRF